MLKFGGLKVNSYLCAMVQTMTRDSVRLCARNCPDWLRDLSFLGVENLTACEVDRCIEFVTQHWLCVREEISTLDIMFLLQVLKDEFSNKRS